MIHVMRAEKLLADDPSENLTVAAKQYTIASGILDYLGTNLLHRWVDNNLRPPEATADICIAFSSYYQALAQRCAVMKAIQNPSPTPPGTLARLAIAVFTLANSALTTIDKLLPDVQKTILPTLLIEMNYTRDLYLGIACYYESKALNDKGLYGAATAYCTKAKVSVSYMHHNSIFVLMLTTYTIICI